MCIVNIRNKTAKFLYKKIARPFFFLFDPELMHNVFIRVGSILGSNPITKFLTAVAFNYQNKSLQQTILGMKFRSPVGLAAGFDKNGEMISIMEDVGFGFVEAGSITANPCPGNEGKRFERLVKEESLWVHFGLNNKGAKVNHERIKNKKFNLPLFVSAAKTNSKETISDEAGLKDYLFTIKTFKDKANAFVLNISCPNAYSSTTFAEPNLFEKFLKEIRKLNIKQPIFVKLSPDLSTKEIDKLISISSNYNIAGFICTNLTKDHKMGKGGLAGKIMEKKANEILSYVYNKTQKSKKKFIIIGTGGISSAEDAYKKIKLGANLVQLITGVIYEGPQLIGEINYDLARLLKRDGYSNISEAVGIGNK